MTTTTRPRRHPYTARHNTYPSPGRQWPRAADHILSGAAAQPTAPARESPVAVHHPGSQLFVDLTSPWAYLAHQRLGSTGPRHVASDLPWAAIQTSTTIPVTGLRGPGPDRDRLRAELAAARAVARDGEVLPDDVPAILPHPRTVAAAFAEAVDLGVGPAVLEVLLRAFWVERRDIGDPEVLRRILPPVIVTDDTLCTGDPRREFGYLVSSAREPLTTQAYRQLEQWQQRWVDLGRPGPLALVEASGTVHAGPAALTR